MIFGLYVYEVLQNITKNRLRMEIYCVIYRFVCSLTKIRCRGKGVDIIKTGIPIL